MATPLPTIATNTEETAFAVLEGNVILDTINVAISDMSKKMTTSIGHLTGAFMSFTENLKEQQAALMAAASLSGDGNSGQNGPGRRTTNDSGGDNSFVDNILEKGLLQAAGISIMASLTSIVTSTVTFFTGIVKTFKNIGKNIVKFGRLARRLFLPITLIIGAIGAVSASWESFANGDIWGGLEKAVTGFFNSVVTIPLDLIKDGIAWLLKKMGFDKEADLLKDFSFTTEFNKIIEKLFLGLKEAVKAVTDLFSFGEEDKTALGLLGKLTDIIFAPINIAIGFIRGLFGWSEEGAPAFKLQDWITTKVDEAIVWVKGLFSWAGDKIAEGWTNLTNYVSEKWEDIKTWITDKLTWATDTIGAGWTSLTDFVSGKWEDIKTWFGEKLTWATDTVGEGANFISQLVTDAWGSIKQWFSDALAGIADALPSWDDITAGIISALPSWMVPDSFKTPGMIAAEIKTKIAENQALVDQIDSGQGGNKGWMLDSVERSRALEKIIADQAALADLAAATAGDTNIVTTNNNNNSSTGAGGGITYPITIREGQPIGGRSAYLATGRLGF